MLRPDTEGTGTGTGAAAVPRALDVFHSAGRLPENRELVSRLVTDLCTDANLYTEASGLSELYPRPLNTTASVGQNYHAIVQSAAIRDAHEYCTSPSLHAHAPSGLGGSRETAPGQAAATQKPGEKEGVDLQPPPPPPPVKRPLRQLTVLTRRTMGVASLGDGEMEYMLMRRIVSGSDDETVRV